MKILFLCPILIQEQWPVLSDIKRLTACCSGVTFPQLAALLGDRDCRIFDGFYEKITISDYLELLCDYDIIALSMVPPILALNMEITVRLIKKVNPRALIIMGGHHATAFSHEWLQRGIDVVVKYEGESTFLEVIECVESKGSLETVKGIVFKLGDRIVETGERDVIADLDQLPMPRWDLINFENYRGSYGSSAIGAAIETSRGCSFSCSFCLVSWMWKKCQRYKSVEKVMSELRRLYDYGARTIVIADDNFGANYERDKKIFQEIINSQMTLNFWIFCRADTILNHPDLMEYAGKAGVREVAVGFETLNIKKVCEYNKNLKNITSIEDYKKVYKILKSNGILVEGCFVHELTAQQDKKPVLEAKYHEVCDFDGHLHFIPLKDSSVFYKLKQSGMLGVDPFYAGIFTFRFSDRLSVFFQNIRGITNPNVFKIIFSLEKRYRWARRRIIHFYTSVFRSILGVSWQKIRVFLWCFSPFLSAAEKQRKIVEFYLNDQYIERLAKQKRG